MRCRLFVCVLVCFILVAFHMAASEEAKVYIVYLEKQDGMAAEALEASHLQTLTSLLGSEEAAKSSILYSYKTVANGFSAKLTPSQAASLTSKPGVVQVIPSQILHLQGAAATGQV